MLPPRAPTSHLEQRRDRDADRAVERRVAAVDRVAELERDLAQPYATVTLEWFSDETLTRHPITRSKDRAPRAAAAAASTRAPLRTPPQAPRRAAQGRARRARTRAAGARTGGARRARGEVSQRVSVRRLSHAVHPLGSFANHNGHSSLCGTPSLAREERCTFQAHEKIAMARRSATALAIAGPHWGHRFYDDR